MIDVQLKLNHAFSEEHAHLVMGAFQGDAGYILRDGDTLVTIFAAPARLALDISAACETLEKLGLSVAEVRFSPASLRAAA
ncbi:MAG: hypothetical protein AAF730_01420 [Bacteroidota bacterium]